MRRLVPDFLNGRGEFQTGTTFAGEQQASRATDKKENSATHDQFRLS
jgi:hypothetical protein